MIIYSLNKSWVWVLLLDSIVVRLEINPNRHAATIKPITLNTFKTVNRLNRFQFSSVQILVYVRLSSADNHSARSHNVAYHISIITENVSLLWHMSLLREKYVIITRKDVILTRKDLVITRKYVVLTRKDLVITRKDVVLMRKDLVITRKDVVLTRKDLVITT